MKDNTCNDVFCKDAVKAEISKYEDAQRERALAKFCTEHYNNEWFNACMYALVDREHNNCVEALGNTPNSGDACKAFSRLLGYNY